MKHDLDYTRLVEEVPGVPEDEQYYIWGGGIGERRTIWQGSSKEAGEKWAAERGIEIEQFEPFEP